jgi:hypothetical protein
MKPVLLLSTLAVGLIATTTSFAQSSKTRAPSPSAKQHLRVVLAGTSVLSKS